MAHLIAAATLALDEKWKLFAVGELNTTTDLSHLIN